MTDLLAEVSALVERIDLEDVICQEERGRRIEWSEEQLEGRTFPEISNSMAIVREDADFLFRFRCVYTDTTAEYVADWVAQFRLPEPEELDSEVLALFAEKVAFFTVYPYMRMSVFGSASRLNQPVPILGLVRQGQFERGSRMSEQDAAATFADVRSERLSGPEAE